MTALDQALLNLSYTKIYAPANDIVGKRCVSWVLGSNPRGRGSLKRLAPQTTK
jgi:hypothetical protein